MEMGSKIDGLKFEGDDEADSLDRYFEDPEEASTPKVPVLPYAGTRPRAQDGTFLRHDPLDRLIERTKFGDCWAYGPTNSDGYGYLEADGQSTLAHRLSWRLLVGPLDDETIDHLCRNHACWNPDHLEPTTHHENVLRGIGPTAMNARKTHCDKGHEFTPENTYIKPSDGSRFCRECGRARTRAWYQRSKEKKNDQ